MDKLVVVSVRKGCKIATPSRRLRWASLLCWGHVGWTAAFSSSYEQILYYYYYFCVKVLLILSLVCTERFF